MRRYDIVNGDTTSAGSLIQGVDANNLIGASEPAYEGDPVSRLACKMVGKIVCDGLYIPTTGSDERQAALSGDLCICQCSPSRHHA